MSMLLVVQQSVTFGVFSFLQPLSYLALGLVLLSFVIMSAIFATRPYVSLYDISCFAFFLLLVIFSVINVTDIRNAIYQSCAVGLLLLLFNYYNHQTTLLLKSMTIAFSCCIYANLALMIFFPNWMFLSDNMRLSFLLGGNYNQMGARFLPALVCCSLLLKSGKLWRINYIVLTITSLMTLVFVNSMTSFASLMVFVMISLIPSLQLRKYAILSLLVVTVLFQVFVVFSGNSLHNNELAVYIIEDLLGKDITFTHRTDMWEQSIDYFIKSPIIGYGYLDHDWYREHMVTYGLGPHNLILAVMLYGGVPLLIVFITSLSLSFKSIAHHSDHYAIKIVLGLTVLLFMSLMEVYQFFFIYLLLTLAVYYNHIKCSLNKKIEL